MKGYLALENSIMSIMVRDSNSLKATVEERDHTIALGTRIGVSQKILATG